MLVSSDTYGATVKTVFDIFCSIYGIVVPALLSGAIGPGFEGLVSCRGPFRRELETNCKMPHIDSTRS